MARFLCALFLCAFSLSSYAAQLRVVATGTFSTYEDPRGLMPFAEPAPGTQFTMSFFYDDVATDDDLFGAGPNIGRYDGLTDLRLTVGGNEYVSMNMSQAIVVANDFLSTSGEFAGRYFDAWQTSTGFVAADGNISEGIYMSLYTVSDNPSVTPLTSDALVQPLLSLGWDIAILRYSVSELTNPNDPADFSRTTVAFAEASIDAISVTPVPVPAAAWLFGSALGLMNWFRCRHTRGN